MSGRETAGFDRLCETKENRAPLPHGGARFYCGLRAWHTTTATALLFPRPMPAKRKVSGWRPTSLRHSTRRVSTWESLLVAATSRLASLRRPPAIRASSYEWADSFCSALSVGFPSSGVRSSASVVRESQPEQSFPDGGIESAVQDVTLRRGVIVDPPASYLAAKDGPERSAIATDAEPEFVERESARRLRFSSPACRGIFGAPLAFALRRSRDLGFPPVRVAGAPTRIVRLSHARF
jgi:hypothetical protein